MSLRNILVIFKKELIDILRDRRAIMFMVLMPVLAIPAVMWLMNQFVSSGVQRLRENASVIAVVGSEESPSMMTLLGGLGEAMGDPTFFDRLGDPALARGLNYMMRGDEMADAALAAEAMQEALSEDDLGSARFVEVEPFAAVTADGQALFSSGPPSFLTDARRLRLVSAGQRLRQQAAEVAEGEEADPASTDLDPAFLADRARIERMTAAERADLDAEIDAYTTLRQEIAAGIANRAYHAVLVLHEGFGEAISSDGTARYTVLFDESVERSDVARNKVRGFLDRLSSGLVRARVDGHGLALSLLDPTDSASINVGRARNLLAYMLPYVVILMCLVGAIYPASDLAAGEKERGTLETLLVTPAARSELVVGKFLVVTLAALTAAVLNIAGLAGSFALGLAGNELAAGLVLDAKAVVVSVLLMLPVAAFFAALLLAVSIFAKSYKEAQSYASGFNLAVLPAALVAFIPGIELDLPLSFAPLISVTLALKEAWSGIFQWDCIAVILLSSFGYAAIALLFCTHWFQREQVLFRT